MNTVLVTGGAGFIGSHTVVELVASGYRPVIVDNFSNSERFIIGHIERITHQPLNWHKHDYSDEKYMRRLIQKEKVEAVIHFAAYKAVGESVENPLKYYSNNVAGLISLLKLIEELGVSQFVFSSSATVYGEPVRLPLTEKAPVKPAASPYGATKQMAEIILRDTTLASKTLRSLALRYFNPIGAHPSAMIGELPRGIPNNLVPFITQTVAGLRDKLTVFGDRYKTPDGTCIRDYIHVVDLAKAHVRALDFLSKQAPSKYDVCNVGTGKGNSVLEVIRTFESVTGQKVPYEIGPRRLGDVTSCYAAVDKARELLGWSAEKSLADALVDAWRWQQAITKPR